MDDDASSQFPGGMSTARSVEKPSIGMGKSVRESKVEDDLEESQLFPGSDLF